MNSSLSIHDRARSLSAQRGISVQAAYSLLGRMGAARRWAGAGKAVASPLSDASRQSKRHLWWLDE